MYVNYIATKLEKIKKDRCHLVNAVVTLILLRECSY